MTVPHTGLRRLMLSTSGFDDRDLSYEVDGPLWTAARKLDQDLTDYGMRPDDITYKRPDSLSSDVFRRWFGLEDRAVIKLAWRAWPLDHDGNLKRLTVITRLADLIGDGLSVLYINDPDVDLQGLALNRPGTCNRDFVVEQFRSGTLRSEAGHTIRWIDQNANGDVKVVDMGDGSTSVVALRDSQDFPSATLAGLVLTSAAIQPANNPFVAVHGNPELLNFWSGLYLASDRRSGGAR